MVPENPLFCQTDHRKYLSRHTEDTISAFSEGGVGRVGTPPRMGIVSNELQHISMRDYSGRDVNLSGFFSSIGLFRPW